MEYKIKSKIWIEIDDKVFLGTGRIKLLKSLNITKSLSKSAKVLGMSYKKAWNLIDSVNKSSKKPIVIKSVGGNSGGGTTLTPYGIKMIGVYDTINNNCWKHLDKQVMKLKIID
ncbi:winged helix-turn-helix domain-containing protein [Tenacibaculum soleae]|uniref:winged helix-turn-helix domain-containing protein n=1 Tax=Tenacibaculum soleae TaxID=447689 RepID=UPI0026E20FBD|nr:winged helix-turn-helix domain-containing protein [Tenacibaculum soleae]MDO6744614.1 winged helix-turn-helix domain-containing protein [Tenacibaculum soleae]